MLNKLQRKQRFEKLYPNERLAFCVLEQAIVDVGMVPFLRTGRKASTYRPDLKEWGVARRILLDEVGRFAEVRKAWLRLLSFEPRDEKALQDRALARLMEHSTYLELCQRRAQRAKKLDP